MFKKVLSFVLAALMIFVAVILTSCEKNNEQTSTERLPATISVLGITSEETTPEAVKAVEKGINELMGKLYKTHIDLTLVTADEYYDLVKERVDLANYYKNLDSAINNYNTSAITAANSTIVYKSFGKWKFKVSSVAATTMTTREKYTELKQQLNEYGILEDIYPEAESPIDVVMIVGKDMYDKLDSMKVLRSIKDLISTEAYTKFTQYIYPTFFELLQAVTGDVKAVPNNNLLADYTYIVVNKDLADKYDFDIETVNGYDDLKDFLADVKAGEDVIPMNTTPDALGIFKLFDDGSISIGTYCNPMIGYSVEENTNYKIQNIFEIPEYVSHVSLMEEYKNAGYFTSATGSEDFAVDVIKGDASIADVYGENYYVRVLQNPFADLSSVFGGMLAVSEFTSSYTRSLEFILELTTNPEIKNLFQYGIEGVNYEVNSDGTISRLNRTYMMDNGTTGNVYMGYPEEGMLPNQWNYVKKTNRDSLINPYLTYAPTATGGYKTKYFVDDATLDGILPNALKRAVVDEAFGTSGYTYDYFLTTVGTGNEARVGNVIKQKAEYRQYFISEIMKEKNVNETQATRLFESTSVGSAASFPYEWYFTKLTERVVKEKYSDLMTASALKTAVLEKIASLAGTTLDKYNAALTSANKFYSNIETLRIMTRLTIWEDLTDAEWEKYEKMGAEDFENAVFTYVKENYEKENNIDDKKYDELVKAFMMSQLKFTDQSDNSSYTISWDEYVRAKDDAQDFFGVIEELKGKYRDRMIDYLGSQFMLDMYSDSEIPELIHEMLYADWLADNGYKKSNFETELYNEILEFLGIDYTTFNATRRTDTTKFAEYMTKIKNQYKNILVEKFSLLQFKNDRISNDQVLSTLLAEKIEEKTGIYKSMCSEVGISYSSYESGLKAMTTFILYANQLRTKFSYTLRTVYSQSEIDAFSYNEIDGVVYNVVSESAFYTNEMCQLISTTLSNYMQAKSDARTYIVNVNNVASELENEIGAKGATKADVVAMKIEEASDFLYGIVEDKFFSSVITVEDMLASVSGEYVEGLKTAEKPTEFVATAAENFNSNWLFTSIVYYLQTALTEALKAE
ncbi:MAG: hypothetical protein IKP68_02145 [Clostridia bacterium]|nr:hypothetical protein [Clostridia bacterium]